LNLEAWPLAKDSKSALRIAAVEIRTARPCACAPLLRRGRCVYQSVQGL